MPTWARLRARRREVFAPANKGPARVCSGGSSCNLDLNAIIVAAGGLAGSSQPLRHRPTKPGQGCRDSSPLTCAPWGVFSGRPRSLPSECVPARNEPSLSQVTSPSTARPSSLPRVVTHVPRTNHGSGPITLIDLSPMSIDRTLCCCLTGARRSAIIALIKMRSASQLELRMNGWGGARKGAGRKPGPGRRPTPHRTRPTHRAAHPVHLTLRARRGLPSLRRPAIYRVMSQCIRLASSARFRIVQFSVQHDHVHLLVEASEKRAPLLGCAGAGDPHRPPAERSTRTHGAGVGRPLSHACDEDPYRSPACLGVCAHEHPQAQRSALRRHRPLFVRALVRWIQHRRRSHPRPRPVSGAPATDLARRARLAPTRPDRSARASTAAPPVIPSWA